MEKRIHGNHKCMCSFSQNAMTILKNTLRSLDRDGESVPESFGPCVACTKTHTRKCDSVSRKGDYFRT